MRLSSIFSVTALVFAGFSAATPIVDGIHISNALVSREELSTLLVLSSLNIAFLILETQVFA